MLRMRRGDRRAVSNAQVAYLPQKRRTREEPMTEKSRCKQCGGVFGPESHVDDDYTNLTGECSWKLQARDLLSTTKFHDLTQDDTMKRLATMLRESYERGRIVAIEEATLAVNRRANEEWRPGGSQVNARHRAMQDAARVIQAIGLRTLPVICICGSLENREEHFDNCPAKSPHAPGCRRK
jgi:hypothetical protein